MNFVRKVVVVLAVLVAAGIVVADEVSDHLKKAQDLHKAGKDVEAKAEIEKALAAIEPLARQQVPAAKVEDGKYTNYADNFRVAAPSKDWTVIDLSPKKPSASPTWPLCQVSYMKAGLTGEDVVIFYCRDLRAFLGAKYADFVGNEIPVMKVIGQATTKTVAQCTDVAITAESEIRVKGFMAVRTDYTCMKGKTPMRCYTIQVLRDNMLFSGIFICAESRFKTVDADFTKIIESLDFSPAPAPGK